jgi:hypothetical protein
VLENSEEIKWSESLMCKFNDKERGKVMGYFDGQGRISEKEVT